MLNFLDYSTNLKKNMNKLNLFFLQALSIYISSLGENHPNTLTVYNNFVDFLRQVIKENRVKELSEHPFTQWLLKELAP